MNSLNHASHGFTFSGRFRALALLCFCAVVVFFATVHSPFLYDDAHSIEDNPHIKDLSKFQQKVGIQNIFNRSVLLLTFSINHALGQADVFGYHLVNIMLHLCVGIILYFLTTELLTLEQPTLTSQFQKLPLVVSLTHLFNPVNVESVTYISSRSSVLVTLFYLFSFYLFVRFSKVKEKYRNNSILLNTFQKSSTTKSR